MFVYGKEQDWSNQRVVNLKEESNVDGTFFCWKSEQQRQWMLAPRARETFRNKWLRGTEAADWSIKFSY